MTPVCKRSWTFLSEELLGLFAVGQVTPAWGTVWGKMVEAVQELPLTGPSYDMVISRLSDALRYREEGEEAAAREELSLLIRGLAAALRESAEGLEIELPDFAKAIAEPASALAVPAEAARGSPQTSQSSSPEEVSEMDVLQDWNVALAALDRGEYDGYSGQFVAVLSGCVVGSGSSQATLRVDVAQRLRVRPERLVILYIDLGEIYSFG